MTTAFLLSMPRCRWHLFFMITCFYETCINVATKKHTAKSDAAKNDQAQTGFEPSRFRPEPGSDPVLDEAGSRINRFGSKPV